MGSQHASAGSSLVTKISPGVGAEGGGGCGGLSGVLYLLLSFAVNIKLL